MTKLEQNKIDTNSKAYKVFWEMYKNDRVSKWLGIEPLVINEGYNEFKMVVRDDMLNGFDILHGGILFAFADSAFAFATNSFGIMSVSTNVNINYHEAVRAGDIILSQTKLVNLSKKFCNLDVSLFKLIADGLDIEGVDSDGIVGKEKKLIGSFYGTAYRTNREFEV